MEFCKVQGEWNTITILASRKIYIGSMARTRCCYYWILAVLATVSIYIFRNAKIVAEHYNFLQFETAKFRVSAKWHVICLLYCFNNMGGARFLSSLRHWIGIGIFQLQSNAANQTKIYWCVTMGILKSILDWVMRVLLNIILNTLPFLELYSAVKRIDIGPFLLPCLGRYKD